MPTSSEIRFQSLDGLRGLASLLVFLAYFCSASGHLGRLPGLFNAVWAVDTFFVLSGFVLSHSFLRREQRHLALAPVELFAQRLLRLWVPFSVATLIGVGLRFALPQYSCSSGSGLILEYCMRWNTQETAFSLLKQFLLLYSPNINAPSWTLPIELLNSLLVPALALLLVRSPTYVLVLSSMSVLSVLHSISIPPYLYLFAAGCALRQCAMPDVFTCWALPVVIISYLIFLPTTALSQDLQQLLMAPAAIFSVLLALNNKHIMAVLCHPLAQLMGRLSFPVYLLHWPLLLGVFPRFYGVLSSFGAPRYLSLAFAFFLYGVVTFFGGFLFYHFVDLPATLWGRRLRQYLAF